MPYTDEQRAEAVDLYVEVGAAEAARLTGVSPRSIRGWAKAAGVAAARDKNLTPADIGTRYLFHGPRSGLAGVRGP